MYTSVMDWCTRPRRKEKRVEEDKEKREKFTSFFFFEVKRKSESLCSLLHILFSHGSGLCTQCTHSIPARVFSFPSFLSKFIEFFKKKCKLTLVVYVFAVVKLKVCIWYRVYRKENIDENRLRDDHDYCTKRDEYCQRLVHVTFHRNLRLLFSRNVKFTLTIHYIT